MRAKIDIQRQAIAADYAAGWMDYDRVAHCRTFRVKRLLYAQGAAMFAPNKHGPVRAGALEAQRQMSTPTFARVVCRKHCRRQVSCGHIGTRKHCRGQTSPSNSITSTASPALTLP